MNKGSRDMSKARGAKVLTFGIADVDHVYQTETLPSEAERQFAAIMGRFRYGAGL